jgi:hypothetical protein
MRGGGSSFYAQGGPYPSEIADPLAEILDAVRALKQGAQT